MVCAELVESSVELRETTVWGPDVLPAPGLTLYIFSVDRTEKDSLSFFVCLPLCPLLSFPGLSPLPPFLLLPGYYQPT